MWQCPSYERKFGKTRQQHDCAPAMGIEEYFSSGPEFERPIFEAVLTHLRSLDADVYFEPLSVGIFFKRRSTFAQLRTMNKWVAVCFSLNRELEHERISRKVIEHGRGSITSSISQTAQESTTRWGCG